MSGTTTKISRLAFLPVLLAAASFMPGRAAEMFAGTARQPIMIELFTSEGCSSCPPADRLAIRLQGKSLDGQEVIILSEHVDYWDYLGWRDKYSSGQFTNRQRDYARVLGANSVYTPEAVVDGTYGMVGSNDRSLREAIGRCGRNPKATLHLSAEETGKDPLKQKVTISTICPASLSGNQAELYIAVTEDDLTSNVRSGENNGATLSHTGVVRYLKKISEVLTLDEKRGLLYKTEITLNPQWKKPNIRLVAFLQDPASQKVWGANQIKID